MNLRSRIALFSVLVLVCIVAGTVYLIVARDQASDRQARLPRAALAPRGSLSRFLTEDHIVFRDTAGGDSFGKVAVVPASAPRGPRAITNLRCDRVDAVANGGICLRKVSGIVPSYEGTVFDAGFRPRFTITLVGVPSRARVSPNGKYAAMTVFVTGDSYAPGTFSTRTDIIDMKDGRLVGNLEGFAVTDNTRTVDAIDQNYWGVTFAPDNDTFYATLSTGGTIKMIKGSVKRRSAAVIAEGVECPSVSPDGTRIAYKKSVASGLATPKWRVHVLNLATKRDRVLAETRSVDDQVEWIDDETIAYSIPVDGSDSQMDTYAVRADGKGKPRKLVSLGSSPSISPSISNPAG